MLSDEERRTLDATAALLALDDPHLAAQLGQHRLIPPPARARRDEAADPPPPPVRVRRIRPMMWPPLVLFVLCLTLLFLPGVLAGRGRADEVPTPGPTTTQTIGDAPASQ